MQMENQQILSEAERDIIIKHLYNKYMAAYTNIVDCSSQDQLKALAMSYGLAEEIATKFASDVCTNNPMHVDVINKRRGAT